MAKGVNTAKSNAQRVRVGDYGSQIVIELTNSENEVVQDLQWIRAYSASQPNITQFIDITDFNVIEGNVYITLPDIPMGQYNIELKDDTGRIYPAEGNIRLNMVQSTNEAVEVYYVNYKDLILDDVTPIIEDYLVSNSDVFRGEKGDAFTWGDLTEEQKEELTGSDGVNGIDGLSAYELALESGFNGSETEWLDSLKGKDGEDGERGSDGKDFTYEDFTAEQLEDLKLKVVETEFDEDGNTIVSLTDGSSFTVNKGSQGTQGERGLQGEQGVRGEKGERGLKGDKGDQGEQGNKGEDGYTPVKGVDYFDGAKGDKGDKGDSFVFSDFTPTQLESLKGEKGDRGERGQTGAKGDKGDTGERGLQGVKGDKGDDGKDGKDGKAVAPKIFTQEEYDNLESYDENTLYFIAEDDS